MTNSPDVVFVRASTINDAATIERHREMSQVESASYRGSVPAIAPRERSITFVAGVGNTVFGSLSLTQQSTTSWSVLHVFVEPDAREIGIGDALVLHALAFLREQNATWLGAQAQPGDRALKNLYERHGLVAQTILVGRDLSDPSTEERASQ